VVVASASVLGAVFVAHPKQGAFAVQPFDATSSQVTHHSQPTLASWGTRRGGGLPSVGPIRHHRCSSHARPVQRIGCR
jgi:hypothetical protein